MDNVTVQQGKKDRILKSLAVGGFVGLIIIIAWLSIKLVTSLPTALTPLASLAESVYTYRAPELLLTTNRSNVAAGDTVELAWNVPQQAGTFSISYSCFEGVSIDVRTGTNTTTIPCGDIHPIGSVSGVQLRIFSERARYVEVPVTVSFYRPNSSEALASSTRSILVTNANIDAEDNTENNNEVEVPTTPTTTPSTSHNATSTNTTTVVNEYHYSYPTSNPNGYTDLAASYITVGSVSNNVFSPLGSLRTSYRQSAVQFEVKNIGTKTSGSWYYVVNLPDGTTYTSVAQDGLKPQERAVITIGFATPTKGAHKVSVTISTTDSNNSNNSFTSSVAAQ